MNTPCIILWDHCFEVFRVFSPYGRVTWDNGDTATFNLLRSAQVFCVMKKYNEVYINSRVGRQILAKIGAQRP